MVLVGVLILASFIQQVQETGVHLALEVPRENYRLGWRLPARDIESATVPESIQWNVEAACCQG
jgi:hypothetical protein